MGQILHGSATTAEAIRRAIQNSQASLRELARATASIQSRGQMAPTQFGLRCPHGARGSLARRFLASRNKR